MDLITPGFGLVFWMLISFGIVMFILKKFAWKPVLELIKEREDTIKDALEKAETAKRDIASMKVRNEEMRDKANEERSEILKEAREIKERTILEAKDAAKEEANKIMKAARESIHNEKMAAITELKNQVASLSIQIAEKILKEELSKESKQKELVNTFMDEINWN